MMTSPIASICCYCGTGCGVLLAGDGQRLLSVSGDPAHPANHGRLCSKGRTLADTCHQPERRLHHPHARLTKAAPRQRVSWEQAIGQVSDRLAATLATHGPEAIGFYLSGQLLTEDYYLFNKLARGLVGTNNIDTNSRLCMSSAVAGYKLTLGADSPPACYEDLEQAEVVLIAGSNMAFAHPILFRRLEEAKARRPEMKIIVVDPRRTDTAELADLYLPVIPGTDIALFNSMLNVMIWENLIDPDYINRHTEGFAALKASLQEFTPKAAAELCGLTAEDIVTAARWFAQSAATLSCYTMGLNQYANGTDKNAALIHLHLATGQIGKAGAGPFSLTGQPNAMGGREVGGLASALSGHRDPSNPQHRAEVAALWQVPSLPEKAGLPAVQLFEAAARGEIKVLWIACTNPVHSMPDQALVRAALERVECVIVQEAFASNETLQYADIILPAATWPEKDGTMTNSERRIARVRAVIPPPSEAREDWRIVAEVAQTLAQWIAPERRALFQFADSAAVFAEHAQTTAGRDLDYSALNYAILDRDGPQQWPYRNGQSQARLYQDGVFATETGKARFHPVRWRGAAETISAHYPLRLTSGRLRDQWHTMSRSGLVASLTRHVEEPVLSLSPRDMHRQRLRSGDLLKVSSKRGSIVLPVQEDDSLRAGVAYIPMHWGSDVLGGLGVNGLTTRSNDPLSQQPELKHAAIRVESLRCEWQATAVVRGNLDDIRPRLALIRGMFPYNVIVPVSLNGKPAVRIRLAAEQVPESEVLHNLLQILEPASTIPVMFDDVSARVLRRIWLHERDVIGFVLAGDIRADTALSDWMDGGPAPTSFVKLLTGQGASTSRAKVVCACMGIKEDAIDEAIAQGASLAALQTGLGCGTGCGSCVPELKRKLVQAAAQGVHA